MEITAETTGQRIHLWRKRRNLTQEAVERAAGLPRSSLSRLETGARDPNVRELQAIAAALRVDPGVLLGDEHEGEDSFVDAWMELKAECPRALRPKFERLLLLMAQDLRSHAS